MRLLFLLLLVPLSGFAEWTLEEGEGFAQRVWASHSAGYSLKCREYVCRNKTETVKMNGVSWDSRLTLRVIDLAPGESVAAAAKKAGAVAAVNGGYFHPDRTPIGLVVSGGETLHPWEKSRLLTGVLSVEKNGKIRILRNAEFKKTDAVREALQAGPFLVDRGKPVPGLNAEKAAERTVVAVDKDGGITLLVTGPITLAGLGELLAGPDFWPAKIERALNLDGGSSAALWLNGKGSLRGEWKRVRNAVIVVEK